MGHIWHQGHFGHYKWKMCAKVKIVFVFHLLPPPNSVLLLPPWKARSFVLNSFGNLECDSTLVVDIFNEKFNTPWKLQNEWLICKRKLAHMNFCISHIYREGNSCADKLASSGITSKRNSTWKSLPSFISIAYNKNRYRFDNL
ncbi:hypothetical protein Lal_00044348 [Lupinus albus]|nr:hypothetical protein Lal_00044348 [Lupinus albus]